jgi:hypothetical protein
VGKQPNYDWTGLDDLFDQGAMSENTSPNQLHGEHAGRRSPERIQLLSHWRCSAQPSSHNAAHQQSFLNNFNSIHKGAQKLKQETTPEPLAFE